MADYSHIFVVYFIVWNECIEICWHNVCFIVCIIIYVTNVLITFADCSMGYDGPTQRVHVLVHAFAHGIQEGQHTLDQPLKLAMKQCFFMHICGSSLNQEEVESMVAQFGNIVYSNIIASTIMEPCLRTHIQQSVHGTQLTSYYDNE